MKKLNNLPKSEDEYWDDAQKYIGQSVRIPICATHGKDWMKHEGYSDNHDGTISCNSCGWGCFLPGFMRVYKGKVYDLRDAMAVSLKS